MTQRLFHMVPQAVWESCEQSQQPYYPETYQQDGFIHLTADPSLLLTVANHFYTASQGDWVVLVLDSSKLTAEVKFEPAAPVGNKSSQGLLQQEQGQGQQAGSAAGSAADGGAAEPLFPHLYGTIDFEAVVGRLPMQRSADGSFTGIQGVPPADCPFSEFT